MDDMMPNDGTYFHVAEPDDQIQERRVEASKAQAAKPMLEDLIAKVQADIDLMSTTDAIHVDPTTDPTNFMRAWYGVQERKAYAEDIKSYMESLLITTRS